MRDRVDIWQRHHGTDRTARTHTQSSAQLHALEDKSPNAQAPAPCPEHQRTKAAHGAEPNTECADSSQGADRAAKKARLSSDIESTLGAASGSSSDFVLAADGDKDSDQRAPMNTEDDADGKANADSATKSTDCSSPDTKAAEEDQDDDSASDASDNDDEQQGKPTTDFSDVKVCCSFVSLPK